MSGWMNAAASTRVSAGRTPLSRRDPYAGSRTPNRTWLASFVNASFFPTTRAPRATFFATIARWTR
jgi:hypothetical protein